jgi:hypothetical protein
VWVAKTAISKGKKGADTHAHTEPEFDDNGNEIKHHEHGVPVEFHLPREGERGHAGAVVKAAFSPQEDFCVTCGKDNMVIMWNLKLKGTKDRVRWGGRCGGFRPILPCGRADGGGHARAPDPFALAGFPRAQRTRSERGHELRRHAIRQH